MIKSTSILTVVAVMATAIALGVFVHSMTAPALGAFSVTLMVLTDSLLIFLPFIFLRSSRRGLLLLPTAIIGLICLAEIIYFRNFSDAIPGASLSLISSVDGLVMDSALASINRGDLIYLLPFISVVIALVSVRGQKIAESSRRFRAGYVCLTILMVVTSVAFSYRRICNWRQVDNLKDGFNAFKEMMDVQTSHKGYLTTFGFNALLLHTIVDSMAGDRPLSDADKRYLENYFTEHQHSETLAKINGQSEKNLILIVVESLGSEVFQAPGAESVLPTLMALASDSSSLVALDMFVEAGVGRSSDAQLIYNTGLLPLSDEPFVSRYASSDYPSLAKALGRSESVDIIGEGADLWHHGETSKSYGYDRLIADCRTPVDADSAIFEAAVAQIRGLRQPFFAEITTLSMHDPYESLNVSPSDFGEMLSKTYPDQRDLNYLQSVAHFDRSLSRFLKQLKDAGLESSTVIAIVGDHEPRHGTLSDKLTGNSVPLIILNGGHPARIDRRVRQSDLFPTLLDLMGVTDYRPGELKAQYRGLGHSLIRPDVDVVSADSVKRKISEFIIRSRYFNPK